MKKILLILLLIPSFCSAAENNFSKELSNRDLLRIAVLTQGKKGNVDSVDFPKKSRPNSKIERGTLRAQKNNTPRKKSGYNYGQDMGFCPDYGNEEEEIFFCSIL